MSGKRGGWRLAGAVLTVVAAATSTVENVAAAAPSAPPRFFVYGTELPLSADDRLVVEQDMAQPDMAVLTLTGSAGRAYGERVKIGAPVSVTAPSTTLLFKGEVVGVEPACDGSDAVTIRAFDRSHRLDRAPRTRTFFGVTDAEIVATVASEHGLLAVVADGLRERHEAVYQHDQTDLDFLRTRAASAGFQVWVEDTKLVVGSPRDGGSVHAEAFVPRLSSSATVQTVTVRGWDPKKRIEIVGEASAPAIHLGEGSAPHPNFGGTEAFTVDHPIFSVEEASAIAKSKLAELTVSRILAEVETAGTPALRVGQPVTLEGSGDRFDGRYLVQGVSHRFNHSPDGAGGHRTLLKVSRQDFAQFILPEVDDEVLVAFEHGDLRQPYVVGSLWDDGADDVCSTAAPRPQ